MKEAKIIDIPFSKDNRGCLAVLERFKEIPFDIQRVFWIYGVPYGETRAEHAHKQLSQFIVAIAGDFVVQLDNGQDKMRIELDTPSKGLLIEPGVWISLYNFSKNAVCLVLAPESYDENEYLKDYSSFIEWKNYAK